MEHVGKEGKMLDRVQYHGTFERLRAVLNAANAEGEWRALLNGHQQFRDTSGAILNWWPSTGTVLMQGDPEAAIGLLEAIRRVVSSEFVNRAPPLNDHNVGLLCRGHSEERA